MTMIAHLIYGKWYWNTCKRSRNDMLLFKKYAALPFLRIKLFVYFWKIVLYHLLLLHHCFYTHYTFVLCIIGVATVYILLLYWFHFIWIISFCLSGTNCKILSPTCTRHCPYRYEISLSKMTKLKANHLVAEFTRESELHLVQFVIFVWTFIWL